MMDTDYRFAIAGLVSLGLFVFSAGASVALFRSARKHELQSADEVMRNDPRPPVVYLRSFDDDGQLSSARGRWRRLLSKIQYTAAVSPEQEIKWLLERVGPMVAIGKPGERLPELGADRLYAHDDTWKSEVTALMLKARLVVIRAGNTPSLSWEVERDVSRQTGSCPDNRAWPQGSVAQFQDPSRRGRG